MHNRFAGVCYRCGKTVEPGQGHFELIPFGQRKNGKKWRHQHADCAIVARHVARQLPIRATPSTQPTTDDLIAFLEA